MSKYLLSLLVVILLAACAPSQPATEQPLPTPARQWTSIKMIQSGGIMGMMRTIEISSDGAMTVADERSNETVTGQLSADELSQLNELIASASFVPPSGFPNACADCFNYAIEVSTPGKTIHWEANDVSLPNSGMEPLVEFLRGLIEEALK